MLHIICLTIILQQLIYLPAIFTNLKLCIHDRISGTQLQGENYLAFSLETKYYENIIKIYSIFNGVIQSANAI